MVPRSGLAGDPIEPTIKEIATARLFLYMKLLSRELRRFRVPSLPRRDNIAEWDLD